jgi:hypothetical protein
MDSGGKRRRGERRREERDVVGGRAEDGVDRTDVGQEGFDDGEEEEIGSREGIIETGERDETRLEVGVNAFGRVREVRTESGIESYWAS